MENQRLYDKSFLFMHNFSWIQKQENNNVFFVSQL